MIINHLKTGIKPQTETSFRPIAFKIGQRSTQYQNIAQRNKQEKKHIHRG